ncbi:MAG: sigma-54 dependent transcriptional regulator [Bacteroidetes bacterium]|jgi:two-component system response regulator AtoC|nr:sigma-54 dependent transcriptional regulator [Bacteroidota bacterium]
MNILIIEDEKISRISLANTIRKEGFEVDSADSAETGLELFEKHRHHVVVTDLRLPNASGMHVLSSVLAKAPETKVVIITAYATVETAIAALRLGAYDYLTKPFSPEKLLSILRNLRRLLEVVDENRELRNRLQLLEKRPLVGVSPVIRQLSEQITLVAQSDATVLIEGESGTGKEIVARAIHQASPRSTHAFVVVSSGGIPESLLESELFGHEKGAFTGAIRRHIGYFERAQQGTIFIDDIDDLPVTMQVKLLRVLQEREIVRVGGSESVAVDVRIIAATKIDLRRQVERGQFREDLFYRLNILPLLIPPLRDRKEDIPILSEHFFKKYALGDRVTGLSEEILSIFMAHDWPGNVRELENIVQRVIALSRTGTMDIAALGLAGPQKGAMTMVVPSGEYPPYEEFMLKKEKEIVGWALQKSGNNASEAARLLKIPRTTLTSRISKLFPSLGKTE